MTAAPDADPPKDEYENSTYRKRKAAMKIALGFIKLAFLVLAVLSFVFFELLAE